MPIHRKRRLPSKSFFEDDRNGNATAQCTHKISSKTALLCKSAANADDATGQTSVKQCKVLKKCCTFCLQNDDSTLSRLLNCFTCDTSAHAACLKLCPVTELTRCYWRLPWQCWRCKVCAVCGDAIKQSQQNSPQKRQRDNKQSKMTICSSCDVAFHSDCATKLKQIASSTASTPSSSSSPITSSSSSSFLSPGMNKKICLFCKFLIRHSSSSSSSSTSLLPCNDDGLDDLILANQNSLIAQFVFAYDCIKAQLMIGSLQTKSAAKSASTISTANQNAPQKDNDDGNDDDLSKFRRHRKSTRSAAKSASLAVANQSVQRRSLICAHPHPAAPLIACRGGSEMSGSSSTTSSNTNSNTKSSSGYASREAPLRLAAAIPDDVTNNDDVDDDATPRWCGGGGDDYDRIWFQKSHRIAAANLKKENERRRMEEEERAALHFLANCVTSSQPLQPLSLLSSPSPTLIHFDRFEMRAWFSSPFPAPSTLSSSAFPPPFNNAVVFVCTHCLTHTHSRLALHAHSAKCAALNPHPPGREIYRDVIQFASHKQKERENEENEEEKEKEEKEGDVSKRVMRLSVFEVDGAASPQARRFCLQLCLLAKLFLDTKTLLYEVERFVFYVITVQRMSVRGVGETKKTTTIKSGKKNEKRRRRRGKTKIEEEEKESTNHSKPAGMRHFIGYFSKEKPPANGRSGAQHNLSCLLVLPPYQRAQFGRFIIDFSYLLSRKSGQSGSPERPLSRLGQLAYESYWRSSILPFLIGGTENCERGVIPSFENDDSKTRTITIEQISKATGINVHDISHTLNVCLNAVTIDNNDLCLLNVNRGLLQREADKFSKCCKNWIRAKDSCLIWNCAGRDE